MVETVRSQPVRFFFHATIFLFINAIFVIKYGARTPLGPVWSLIGYLVFFGLQAVVGAWLGGLAGRAPNRWAWPLVFVGAYTALALTAYLRMNPEHLNVDRWSALDHFLRALFRGEYPYQARTHLGSPISGFPGLFLLVLPFYALGDVGLMQFAALIAFAALLVVRLRDGGRALSVLVFLAAMPVFAYEVFCRSDLFSNMVATAWLLHLGSRAGAARGGRLWGWAIAWGLMLSTRGIVLIPMIFAAPALLKGRKPVSAAAFFLVAGAVMAATLVPFYLWDARLFWEHNPYDVQSGYISRWMLALVLFSCAVLAYRYRAAPRPFLHTGLSLFATVLACWFLTSVRIGWGEMMWQSGFDLTYFCLGVPFLLVALGESLSESRA